MPPIRATRGKGQGRDQRGARATTRAPTRAGVVAPPVVPVEEQETEHVEGAPEQPIPTPDEYVRGFGPGMVDSGCTNYFIGRGRSSDPAAYTPKQAAHCFERFQQFHSPQFSEGASNDAQSFLD